MTAAMTDDTEQPATPGSPAARIGVCADPATDGQLTERAQRLAADLSLPMAQPGDTAFDLLLTVTPQRVELRPTAGKIGPVYCDFSGGAFAQRIRTTGARDLLPRALGFKHRDPPHVLDATAGLGRDAATLALMGCRVTAIERSPIIATLLRDGLERATLLDRVELIVTDARDYIRQFGNRQSAIDNPPTVIYLDPMFPHRDKSALVKKEMRIARAVTGEDTDAAQLLAAALTAGRALKVRVVVKRPLHAPHIPGDVEPSMQFKGTSIRYDAYLPPVSVTLA